VSDETETEKTPEQIKAEAALLEAQAAFAKAKTPFWDKLILRGVVPIALAVVGPWALYQFNAEAAKNEKARENIAEQVEVTKELKGLLATATAEREERLEDAKEWRGRMNQIEKRRAVELQAMVSMVNRLDDTLKTALIQMAVSRLISQSTSSPLSSPQDFPTRGEVVEEIHAEIQLPGANEEEVERLAGEAYDRMLEQRARKARKK